MIKIKDYPTSLYIGGEEYTIRFCNIKHCGDTNAATKMIRIRRGMSERETLATLVHELLHAGEFEFGIKVKHKAIYKFERAIMSLLLDNFFLNK